MSWRQLVSQALIKAVWPLFAYVAAGVESTAMKRFETQAAMAFLRDRCTIGCCSQASLS